MRYAMWTGVWAGVRQPPHHIDRCRVQRSTIRSSKSFSLSRVTTLSNCLGILPLTVGLWLSRRS